MPDRALPINEPTPNGTMTPQRFPRLKPFLAVTVLALSVAVFTQQTASAHPFDDCGPIQGTIQVADDAPYTTKMELARITEAQAREVALGVVAGATVQDVDLDEEDGFLIYEVDLVQDGQEHDVYVDAGSGEVLCTERD